MKARTIEVRIKVSEVPVPTGLAWDASAGYATDGEWAAISGGRGKTPAGAMRDAFERLAALIERESLGGRTP